MRSGLGGTRIRLSACNRLRAFSAGAFTILTITNSAGSCLITTAAPHGLATDATITVSGNSVSGYNTTHVVVTTPSTTTFTTNRSYTSSGTGGSWA